MLASLSAARGQMLEISPVSITLAPDQRTTSVTVTNRGTAPVTVQIRPFRWQEEAGTSSLTETAALAASPPFAEVAPGQSQSIRLLLRQPPGASEATYRLLVDQLPPAEQTQAIRIALRLSVPVFALPAAAVASDLQWTIETVGGGAFLAVRNRGSRHAQIIGVQLGGSRATPIAVRTAQHPYVLPGAHVRWPIEHSANWSGAPVPLTITSNTGVSSATASIVSATP